MILGGITNPVYALLIAYTNDFLSREQMAGASAGLIFLNGFGAVFGTPIAGAVFALEVLAIGYLATGLRPASETLHADDTEDIAMVRGLCPPFDAKAFLEGHLTPVFFGSAVNNFGVRELLHGLAAYAPAPCPRPALERGEISPSRYRIYEQLMDEAARQSVRLSAPFQPFPAAIRRDTDILHITRTWHFRNGAVSSEE